MLLVQESRGFRKGLWGLPGGQLSSKESIEEGIQREVYEEVGIKTEIIRLLSIRELGGFYFGKREFFFLFWMKALNFDIKLDDSEISAYKWHSKVWMKVLSISS